MTKAKSTTASKQKKFIQTQLQQTLPAFFNQTSLPLRDDRPQERERALTAAQARYVYDYDQLPGIAMIKTLPLEENPSFEWVSTVGHALINILWNQKLARSAYQRQHWLRLYRYSLKENIRFFTRELTNYIEHVLPNLFNEFGTDAKGAYQTLNAVISAWRPDMVNSLEEIASNFSGLLPLLRLDEPRGPAKKMAEYKALFQSIKPPRIAEQFQTDEAFGYLRVAGANPTLIKAAPENWPSLIRFNNEQFQQQQAFAQDSLELARKEKRLFILQFPYIEHLQRSDFPAGQKFIGNPVALLAVPKDRERKIPLPVAIQCDFNADITFTPKDRYSWLMAKNMVQVADSNYHELVAHLSHTHLVMEAFVLATHRRLAPRHPIYLLLTPHFEGTAFINWAAQEYLVAKGNYVDQLLAGSIESSKAVVVKAMQSYRFNAQMLPQDIQSRGVGVSTLHYPYRDDALRLWHAISGWVQNYLSLYYPSEQSLKQDKELAAWAMEVHAPQGGKIQDFGDDGAGSITTLDYLTDALTMVIFTASVQHAAVNFPQRSIMSFTPAGPLASYGPAPNKYGHTKAEWRAQFPPLQMATQQLAILDLLGSIYYGRLGQYRPGYFQDPVVLPLIQDFIGQLQAIEASIRSRNADDVEAGLLPYETLLPSLIPQSINI